MVQDFYPLIVPSFLDNYGIDLLEEDIPFEKFMILLSSIRKGVLVEYIRIRTENDPERIAKFSESEMEIYSDWQQKLMEDFLKIEKRKREGH